MGVATAVFCLAGGIMSLIGGELMAVDLRLPYYIAGGTALLGLAVMLATWDRPEVRALLARPGAPGRPSR